MIDFYKRIFKIYRIRECKCSLFSMCLDLFLLLFLGFIFRFFLIEGFVDDYVYVIRGFLDLYEVC